MSRPDQCVTCAHPLRARREPPDGITRPHYGNGLCSTCYTRKRRNDTPTMTIPGPWMDEAKCNADTAEMFFPEKGDPKSLGGEAKAICAGCPVIEQCLEWALETNERYGVWGGTTAYERRALRRERLAS